MISEAIKFSWGGGGETSEVSPDARISPSGPADLGPAGWSSVGASPPPTFASLRHEWLPRGA